MARKKGSKDYPIWMKQEAIRLSKEEGWLNSEITEQFGIRDPKRVKNWLWRYNREGERMFSNLRERSGRKPKKENTEKYIARLEMEVEVLKKLQSEMRKNTIVKRIIGQSTISKDDIQ